MPEAGGLTIPVPVAHSDSPPSGPLAAIFTSAPANEFTENWVGIDLVTARKLGRRLLRAFQELDAVYPRP